VSGTFWEGSICVKLGKEKQLPGGKKNKLLSDIPSFGPLCQSQLGEGGEGKKSIAMFCH
jgi:hypothetical protein